MRRDALALLLAESTQADARALAANLGVELLELADRRRRCRPTSGMLAGAFDGRDPDITEENLQARIRGNLLMALSNKFGWLVLTTGNKSEMSVGYSTLYGDMAGGFAVIKDVPKTLVYRSPATATRASGRERADPAAHHRPAAERRAAPRPARRGLAAALRGARPDPRGLRRGGPRPRAARSPPGFDARGRRPRDPRWSTAPSTSAARRRPGSRSRRAPSGATGACRSPTATGG